MDRLKNDGALWRKAESMRMQICRADGNCRPCPIFPRTIQRGINCREWVSRCPGKALEVMGDADPKEKKEVPPNLDGKG